MRRVVSAVLVIAVVLSLLASCSASSPSKTDDGKLRIVTTVFPPYDFAKNIVGDKAEVTMLLPAGTESHSYELTAHDCMTVKNCDLFICISGEGEMWVDKLLSSIEKPSLSVVSILDAVSLEEEEHVEGMENHDEDSAQVEYDEHVWTSPVNAQLITRYICEKLCEIDEENASFYRQNCEKYIERLEKLDGDFREMISGAKRNRIVVADRFPFRYLCEEYSLDYSAAFAGCEAATDPSARTVKYLIDKVNEENIPVVFYIEFSQKTVANVVLASTQAKGMELHSCHNVSKEDFDSSKGYIEIMEQNLKALKEALN